MKTVYFYNTNLILSINRENGIKNNLIVFKILLYY